MKATEVSLKHMTTGCTTAVQYRSGQEERNHSNNTVNKFITNEQICHKNTYLGSIDIIVCIKINIYQVMVSHKKCLMYKQIEDE